MIILFLVDTSASMNQRTVTSLTFLDVAKTAIANFIKMRISRQDRYMLVSYEDGYTGIKAGWGATAAQFTAELAKLRATDLSRTGPALKACFELLNLYRLQKNIDTYGQGRLPWMAEPAAVVHFTDGTLNPRLDTPIVFLVTLTPATLPPCRHVPDRQQWGGGESFGTFIFLICLITTLFGAICHI